jgi:hypothetical protein
MPEVWLGYGDTEVILDIKYENILDNVKPQFSLLNTESLNLELANKIKLKNSNLIIIFTPFLQMIPILKYIYQEYKKQNNNSSLEFNTTSKYIPFKIKRVLNDNGIYINRIENKEILNKIKNVDKTIILEKVEIDPFFGYKGPSTELIRACFPNEMNIAFSSIYDKLPQPGQITEALNISIEKSRAINCEVINVIANNDGINSIYVGEMEESFKKTIDTLDSISKREVDKSKSAFITGNSNFNIQATLNNSLNLLWNNYDTVKENGILVLISENKYGLENGALLQFIEERLDQRDLKKSQYIKDLEHINFLNVIGERFKIYIISSIPKVYLHKLGLKPIPRIKDGLNTILSEQGKSTKILIISNSELIKLFKKDLQNNKP